MSWYKDWFSSEGYLKVYSHRDDVEAEILAELIMKNINLNNDASVLDMACGAGRHSIALAKRGFKVTAVDLSERLLIEARKNSQIAGVEINYMLSDIREFNSEYKFDLALNLFTSIGYFDEDNENFSVIKKAYDLLKKNGYFVLDYFNKDYLVKNLVPTSVISVNGDRIVQNRSIKGNRVVKNITIAKNSQVNEFYESVRLFSFDELSETLSKTGFKIEKVLGDFKGNIFDKTISSRIIFIAKK